MRARSLGVFVAALLAGACAAEDEGGATQPVVDSADDARDAALREPPMHDATVPAPGPALDAMVARDAAGNGPGSVDDAAANILVDTEVLADAGAPGGELTQPSIPRDFAAPVCFPARVQPPNGAFCLLDEHCIPGSLFWRYSTDSASEAFHALGYCHDGSRTCDRLVRGGYDIELFLSFARDANIGPSSTSEQLRAALTSVYGSSRLPESLSFRSDPSLIEVLSNENGRLHAEGWGMVWSVHQIVPAPPHNCSNELLNICTLEVCYFSDGYERPASWFHFDIEAPFTG